MRTDLLLRIDRRLLFALMLLAVAVPFLVDLPSGKRIPPESRQFYEFLDALEPSGGAVLFSLDYAPDSAPEVEPIAVAALHHLATRRVPVLLFTAVEDNQGQAERLVRRLLIEADLSYGEDLVFLGFKPEIRPLIISMAREIRGNFPTDYRGTPLDELPLTADLHRLSDLALVLSVASDDLCLDWITFGAGRFDVPLAFGVSANLYGTVKPFVDSGQILAILRGMKGAAEYEQMLLAAGTIERTGDATRGMGSQSAAHLLLLGFILVGNLGVLLNRARRTESRS